MKVKMTRRFHDLSAMDDSASVLILRALHDELDRRVKKSEGEFRTIEQHIENTLSKVLKPDLGSTPSEEDEEHIKDNLKQLGYLGLDMGLGTSFCCGFKMSDLGL